jgi:hypothetical protein
MVVMSVYAQRNVRLGSASLSWKTATSTSAMGDCEVFALSSSRIALSRAVAFVGGLLGLEASSVGVMI